MRIAGILTGLLFAAAAAAQPAPDYARAKARYADAEAAMAEARYADAARDFREVYDLTQDPVVFYKLGTAYARTGECDVAVQYYRRYLAEAHPSEAFATQARERIAACGAVAPAPPAPATPAPGASAPATPPEALPPLPTTEVTLTPTPGPRAPARPGRDRAAWLCVSGSLAFLSVGAVLAYSASAAENDVADLYVGLSGGPPAYDTHTRSQYEALTRDGRRYEVMSWMSFGVAGLAAVAAASLFIGDRHEHARRAPVIAPTISRDGGGVAATLRF